MTTKWNRISHDEGQSREDEIIHQHWQSLVERGSVVRRYAQEQDAQQIINDLLLLIIMDDNSDELSVETRKLLSRGVQQCVDMHRSRMPRKL